MKRKISSCLASGGFMIHWFNSCRSVLFASVFWLDLTWKWADFKHTHTRRKLLVVWLRASLSFISGDLIIRRRRRRQRRRRRWLAAGEHTRRLSRARVNYSRAFKLWARLAARLPHQQLHLATAAATAALSCFNCESTCAHSITTRAPQAAAASERAAFIAPVKSRAHKSAASGGRVTFAC